MEHKIWDKTHKKFKQLDLSLNLHHPYVDFILRSDNIIDIFCFEQGIRERVLLLVSFFHEAGPSATFMQETVQP